MKKIYLVHGEPGSGKTTLAHRLESQYEMKALSIDRLYVEFVGSQYPELCFRALGSFISPHFYAILKTASRNRRPGDRDPLEEWKEYVAESIRKASESHDCVVAEGFLLRFGMRRFMEQLSEVALVVRVRVRDHRYRAMGRRMTIEEIAALSSMDGRRKPNGDQAPAIPWALPSPASSEGDDAKQGRG